MIHKLERTLLEELSKLLVRNPLTIWVPLYSNLTSWAKVPFADEVLCDLAKEYGKLGMWILETEEQLAQAKNFGADVIETTGSLKP